MRVKSCPSSECVGNEGLARGYAYACYHVPLDLPVRPGAVDDIDDGA